MKGMSHTASYHSTCHGNTYTGAAITVESGVLWQEAYAYADTFGLALVGGASGSVSAAGGYLERKGER